MKNVKLKCYCLNLKHRTDRKINFEKYFPELDYEFLHLFLMRIEEDHVEFT